ncbi:MAG: hypothetical protein ACE5FL_11205, partial [Myxococcota bacterium]
RATLRARGWSFDELVESAALMRGVRRGNLDRIQPPVAPLDILAQQIVASCGAGDWKEDALFALMRRAAPFAALTREDFDAVVAMVADGVQTGRGRRGAYLHRDRVGGMLRGRRGARLAALTSGGAIPETADYRVVTDPDDTFIGTVNEDWAVESMAGDVFLLGSTSWRIRRIEAGVVRVADAHGAPPSIPFWLGEAPARTEELSAEVSELRAAVDARLARADEPGARDWLQAECAVDTSGSEQIVRYFAAARAALGVIPTQEDVVIERFFDETGGMQIVVHAPFGGRINRAFGLAVRKRICRAFDFELQAAANDDSVVLSLGPQHSFPLADFPRMLSSRTAAEALSQAVLASPLFAARWRWNLGRSLLVLRRNGGRRNPPPIQRMQADDFMAAIFPRLAACQENVTGPIEFPDHPLVRQTLEDCLHEAMDVDGLTDLLRGVESGAVRIHTRETTEPSVLTHEILNGRPYTFLDDAPLEERRTRAVTLRRGLPETARDLGELDAEAIARVRDEARPQPRDAEETHDALLGFGVCRPVEAWRADFEALVRADRAATVWTESGPMWFARESRALVDVLHPGARVEPDLPPLAALAAEPRPDRERAVCEVVRGHLDATGPETLDGLANALGLRRAEVEQALAHLEAEGFLLRGSFCLEPAEAGVEEFCARRLLARIHRYTHARLRREIEPVTAQDLMRFLLRWQHATPETRREGRRGTLAVVEQLQGFELAAGAWEERVLAARVEGYRREWLDDLCLAGEVVWGRATPRVSDMGEDDAPGRGGAVPSRSTPITLALRGDLRWWLAASRGAEPPALPGPGAALDVFECLRSRGALFQSELIEATGRLPLEVEEALWDLVSRGRVAADGFQSLRSLLGARSRHPGRRARRRRGLRRGARGRGVTAEGRWALLPPAEPGADRDELVEAVAEQLLARWGVVFRDLIARENLDVSWRELLYALRRFEDRGAIRGGRFVTGFSGEQFALPGAVEALRQTRRSERRQQIVRLSAADPLNLVGILSPGPRVPALRSREVVYCDGLPLETGGASEGADVVAHPFRSA